MGHVYRRTFFSDAARALQHRYGSRAAYAKSEAEAEPDGAVDPITEREATFIGARDSFYIASVTADGWPYVQHRGGPPGFLHWLGGNRIGFADYRGNRQYISAANLADDPRVSLFLVDYANRHRLKIAGHARLIDLADDPALVTSLMPRSYHATPERAIVIDVVGHDWNCSQHILPRFTEAEISAAVRPMAAEINRLRAEIAVLRAASTPEGDSP